MGATAVSDVRPEPGDESGNWTFAIRRWLERQLPLDSLLPHRMPYYLSLIHI